MRSSFEVKKHNEMNGFFSHVETKKKKNTQRKMERQRKGRGRKGIQHRTAAPMQAKGENR